MPRALPPLVAAGLLAALGGAGGCAPNDIVVGSNLGGAGGGTSTGGGGTVLTGVACPTTTGFPAADLLANVTATVAGGDVHITFDPREDAADYRVYVLPNASDVSGSINKNATYRCAGAYEVPPLDSEDQAPAPGAAMVTRIQSAVAGYTRAAADAQLGWVLTTPGPDRIPVYALGDPATLADNDCYFQRYPESRAKRYTTSDAERAQLLAQRWRDDGIAFYAPRDGAAGSQVVYRSDALYLTAGAERDARVGGGASPTPAFSVFTTAPAGGEPLMRVYYDLFCNARGHDELVAGKARFAKAYRQGTQPVPALHWTGLGAGTTLVVEAVDQLCPFQGILSPRARPAGNVGGIDYPALVTPDDVRAASPAGEVYVNGQGAATTPHAVARACLEVAPTPPAPMDWRYDGHPETLSPEVSFSYQSWKLDSPTFDFELDSAATDEWGIGSLFGELWVTWADHAAGTSGLFRFSPKTKAALAADTFLHATMTVDIVTTDRRYPQLVLADQGSPASWLVLQTRGGITTPVEVELQLCAGTAWDPGAQCPAWDLQHLGPGPDFRAPHLEVDGIEGGDRTVRFDVHASTGRAYVFVDGLPYACVDLPAGKLAAGQASVIYGDVLFVSSQDFSIPWYPFHAARMHTVTSRHFSNLGFSSHAPPPAWDEARLPCVPASALN